MFRSACATVSQFTFPIVICRKTFKGECSSSIGAFVVINEDGWIITAHHLVKAIADLEREAQATSRLLAQRETILSDQNLNANEKRKQLRKLPNINPSATVVFSVWYGIPGVNISVQEWTSVEVVDIAVGRLTPFDPKVVRTYPKFKNPAQNFLQGTSLCKIGFPFYSITPTWDEVQGVFQFPPGALPMPLFPLEGMLTREINIVVEPATAPPPPFPLKMLETSSPGLRGQSGGPTFDTSGAIWAIQSHTAHLDLGFNTKNQFLNVGIGTHSETILRLFTSINVRCDVTDY